MGVAFTGTFTINDKPELVALAEVYMLEIIAIPTCVWVVPARHWHSELQ